MLHATAVSLEWMYKFAGPFNDFQKETGKATPKLMFEINHDSKFIKYLKSLNPHEPRYCTFIAYVDKDIIWCESQEDEEEIRKFLYKRWCNYNGCHRMPAIETGMYAFAGLAMNKVLQDLAVEGVHELRITADQAIRLAQAKLPIKPSEVTLPYKNMFVHIPKETFARPEMQQFLEGVKHISKHEDVAAPSKHDNSQIQAQQIIDAKVDVVININQNTNSLIMWTICNPHKDVLLGGLNDFYLYWDVNTIENQMFNVIRSEEVANSVSGYAQQFHAICHKIALGAALVSTIKNSIINAAYPSVGVKFERDRLMSRLSKIVMFNDIRTSVILQPNMKSLRGFGTSKRSVTEAVTDETKTIIINRRPYEVAGHHRNQRVGKGRTETRRLWVRKHIRNKHLLDTTTPTILTSTEMTHPLQVIEDVVKASQEVASSPE